MSEAFSFITASHAKALSVVLPWSSCASWLDINTKLLNFLSVVATCIQQSRPTWWRSELWQQNAAVIGVEKDHFKKKTTFFYQIVYHCFQRLPKHSSKSNFSSQRWKTFGEQNQRLGRGRVFIASCKLVHCIFSRLLGCQTCASSGSGFRQERTIVEWSIYLPALWNQNVSDCCCRLPGSCASSHPQLSRNQTCLPLSPCLLINMPM